MKKIFLFLFVSLFSTVFAQSKIEFFPSGLTIQPFAANTLEPRLGFVFHTTENQLTLNIGNSFDILRGGDSISTYSFGADMFTYTRLSKEGEFHFPVDAVDYLFGVNFGYKTYLKNFELGARVRISHISAHLVDGHFDNTLDVWKDSHNPRVFSREFLEVMPYARFNSLRVYAGLTYLFHVDPVSIGKDNYQVGFDFYLPVKLYGIAYPYIGYDFKLIHNDSYSGNNSIVAGLKFGSIFGKGVSLYYQYYSGNSIHGEYFDYKVDYSAIGINLDL